MINPTEKIEMTRMYYATQFNGKPYKYYNDDFYSTPIRLGKMYLNKYNNKKYQFTINPFKAKVT